MKKLLLLAVLFFLISHKNGNTPAIAQTIPGIKFGAITKYIFVVVRVNDPVYDDAMTSAINDGKHYYKPKYSSYTSGIITISPFNEEKRYRIIDRVRQEVYDKEVGSFFTTLDFEERRPSIVSADSYLFSSYKEASIARTRFL